jgi:hypothetical protein
MHPVTEIQKQVLVQALSYLRTPLLKHLKASIGPAATDSQCKTALLTLAEIGTPSDLPLLASIAARRGKTVGVSRLLVDWFGIALQRILERSPMAAEKLAGLYPRLHPYLRAPSIRAIGTSSQRSHLSLLADLLCQDEDMNVAILEQIERIAGSIPYPAKDLSPDGLRELLHAALPECRALAARSLGHLQDSDSIPQLIQLLKDPVDEAQQGALQALWGMTGLRFPLDRARWELWYAEELRWQDTCAADTLDSILGGEPTAVFAALRELSMHKIALEDHAQSIAGVLRHEETTLRRQACIALMQLGASSSIPALLDAMIRDEDQTVQKAAWQGLVALTGMSLPLDCDLWRERLQELY